MDVGSSRAAASAVGLVRGATTSLCIDMAILLEGHSDEELPERLLGTVRFDRLDLTSAAYLEKDQQRWAVSSANCGFSDAHCTGLALQCIGMSRWTGTNCLDVISWCCY